MEVPSLTLGAKTNATVIDLGSASIRVGSSMADQPESIFDSVVVRDTAANAYLFGDRALTKPVRNHEILPIIKEGRVADFDRLEYFFMGLLSSGVSNAHPFSVFQPSCTSVADRKRLATLLFEKCNLRAAFFGDAESAAAYSVGRTNALVIDVGFGKASYAPIVDGKILRAQTQQGSVTGSVLLDCYGAEALRSLPTMTPQMVEEATAAGSTLETLGRDLYQQGGKIYQVDSASKRLLPQFCIQNVQDPGTKTRARIYRDYGVADSFTKFHVYDLLKDMLRLGSNISNKPLDISSSLTSIGLGFGGFGNSNPDIPLDAAPSLPSVGDPAGASGGLLFTLPDGHAIDLLKQSAFIPEGLFNTNIISQYYGIPLQEHGTVQFLAHQSVARSSDIIQKELLANVLPVGGVCSMQGFCTRLKTELEAIVPGTLKVKVTSSYLNDLMPRSYAPWIGGSILSSLGVFPYLWVSKEEFQEYGVSIIERRRM